MLKLNIPTEEMPKEGIELQREETCKGGACPKMFVFSFLLHAVWKEHSICINMIVFL